MSVHFATGSHATRPLPLPSLAFPHAHLLLSVLSLSWKRWLILGSSWSNWSRSLPVLPHKHIHHFLPVLTALTTSSPPWASLLATLLTSSDLLTLCLQTPAWHHSVSPTRERKPCTAHMSRPCLCFQPHHLTLTSGELCCQHWIPGPPGPPIPLCLGVFWPLLFICLPNMQMSIQTLSLEPFLDSPRSRCFSTCTLTTLCT